MTPVTESSPPFWGYVDLLIFAGLMFPALGVALLATQGFALAFHIGKPLKLLLIQLVWYVLLAGVLGGIFRLRYSRSFWDSLGFKRFGNPVPYILGGPLLAFGVGALGYLIHTPIIKLPMFDQMLSGRATVTLFSLFVVVLGPLCEELAFRGFLMPLLMRSFGVISGIVGSAILFGSLHASEYEWSWKHVLLISIVGVVFGWVRHSTGSTSASTLLHSTFNLTQLVGFFANPNS